jgi:peptidoglycan/LPS O-acetylase OafA/YrhL
MKNNTNFIYLLRFIAAIFVVFYHYSPVRNVLIDNGDEAVSFFFLLSGFILVIAYKNEIFEDNPSIISFYVKRIARIYPLYFLALFLTLGYHFFVHHEHTHLQQKLPFEILMVQTWFYPGSINYPAWSISCEIFFYALFPLYIFKLKNLSLKLAITLATLMLLGTTLFSYFALDISNSLLKPSFKDGYLYQHPIFRFPVFLVGNVLGLMYLKNIKISTLLLLGLFLMGCLSIFLWNFKAIHIGSSLKQVGFLFIYVVLIVILLQNEAFSMKYLSNKKFTLLGDMSYSIYLLQFPISSFVLIFTKDFATGIHFFTYITLLFFCSFIAFQYFEKPARTKIVVFYNNVAKYVAVTTPNQSTKQSS